MVRVCCVPSCRHTHSLENRNPCRMLHFPNDIIQCRKWIQALGNRELLHVSYPKITGRYVCACHFADGDLKTTGKRVNRIGNPIPITPDSAQPLCDDEVAEYPPRPAMKLATTRIEVPALDLPKYLMTNTIVSFEHVQANTLTPAPQALHMFDTNDSLEPAIKPVVGKQLFSATEISVNEVANQNACSASNSESTDLGQSTSEMTTSSIATGSKDPFATNQPKRRCKYESVAKQRKTNRWVVNNLGLSGEKVSPATKVLCAEIREKEKKIEALEQENLRLKAALVKHETPYGCAEKFINLIEPQPLRMMVEAHFRNINNRTTNGNRYSMEEKMSFASLMKLDSKCYETIRSPHVACSRTLRRNLGKFSLETDSNANILNAIGK